MAYLAPIHRPSSVRHALKIKLLSSEEESLVVAKANRLEIYAQSSDGLDLTYSRSIYGKIVILQKLRAPDSDLEHLFVGTDRYVYFSLSWDDATKQFKTEKTYVDQAERIGRDSQALERCLVDPTQHFLLLELFEGILTVIPLTYKETKRKNAPETRALLEPVPVRVEELFIRSSAFAYPEDKVVERDGPRLAVLYHDNHDKVYLQVKILECQIFRKDEQADADFGNLWPSPTKVDLSASHVIPVPAPHFGVIVLAEKSISHFNLERPNDPCVQSLEEPTVFATWEQIDEKRWLLADDYGNLYFLMLGVGGRDGVTVTGFHIDYLGQTSRASVLLHLGGGHVYLGSHSGNSQLIVIRERGFEVLQTLPNIAPVVDFTIMDMGSREGDGQTNEFSSGQARIVTGSGAFQDGSVRSVRSGVGLEDLGSLPSMHNITNIFPLKIKGPSNDVLLTSFIHETRAFQFSPDGDVEELQEQALFDFDNQTIHAQNIADTLLLQVTTTAVILSDPENGMVVARWSPAGDATIVASSASNDIVLVSVGGSQLIALDVRSDLAERSSRTFDMQSQISCLVVPSISPQVCLVGSWHEGKIAVLDIATLKPLKSIQVAEAGTTVPRSIVLAQLLPDHLPTLLVAMADGNVVTFDVNTSNWELSSKKSTILGTQQASLTALHRGDGSTNIFASCENPSIIYGSEGRLVFSAVTVEKVTCVCPFDSEAYPDAIAIASPDDLKIVLVDEERTTHVQTLPIGETVRRIAYSTNLKAFGLGTIRRTLQSGEEIIRSHFKLADEVVFKELDTYELNTDEIVESVLRADITQGFEEVERFVVGTAYSENDESEHVRGRILVFEVTEDRKLKVVTECKVKGACRALAVLGGKIVAALTKTIIIYEMENNELFKNAAYRTSTAPIDIVVKGNIIAIADLIKSVSIVRYEPGERGENPRLVEIARHFQIAWSTALAVVDDNTFLEADAEGNLMVLRQNIDGVSPEDKRRLEVTSEIQLGEMVNRIRTVNFAVSDEAVVIPRAFMATVDGSIYLFAMIKQDKQDLLMRLQQNIASFVKSPGDIPFATYRAFRNQVREAAEPFRFVDGELIEKFLDCTTDIQEKIVEDLNTSVEEARVMVESLRRLH